MKALNIKVTPHWGRFIATVETSKGIRYHATYADKPTVLEVSEDFRNPKTKRYFEIIK